MRVALHIHELKTCAYQSLHLAVMIQFIRSMAEQEWIADLGIPIVKKKEAVNSKTFNMTTLLCPLVLLPALAIALPVQ